MRRVLLSLFLFITFLPHTYAQTDPPEFEPEAFHQAMLEVMADYEIPGVVVGLVQGDNLVYVAGLGENAAGEPIDPEATFDIGPIVQPIIATAILILAERGQLNLHTPLPNLVPQFHLNWEREATMITIGNLLIQTAGLGAADLPNAEALDAAGFEDFTITLPFPGARYSYCDRCYALLLDIISRLSGQSFAQFMNEEIFYPLGMDQTTITEDGHITSTAADLARLMSVHVQQGRWRSVQIITPDSILQMHRSHISTERSLTEYAGYGWLVEPDVLPGEWKADILPGNTELERNRVLYVRGVRGGTGAMALIPPWQQGVVLLTDQPISEAAFNALLETALEHFTGYVRPAPVPPDNYGWFAGEFTSDALFWGGTLLIENRDGALYVTYSDQTAPAVLLDDRTIQFPYTADGHEWGARIYFHDRGQAIEATLSVGGETAVYYRKN